MNVTAKYRDDKNIIIIELYKLVIFFMDNKNQ